VRPAFLVVDKPAGITSHDVVAAVRAVTGIAKVGHTGTLDPFATGVLPLALGPATKLIQFVDESVKVYDAVIAFGAQTDTGDPSGKVVREAPKPRVGLDEVVEVVRGFVGERMQKPPAYSAVKKGGKPLYYYARKGEPVDVPARPITIHDVDVRHYDQESLRVVIRCSRGTYARVLADEVAAALGSAGHLAALERPRSGPFYLEDAIDMARLAVFVAAESGHTWEEVLLRRSRKAERVPWKRREEVLEALTRRPPRHRCTPGGARWSTAPPASWMWHRRPLSAGPWRRTHCDCREHRPRSLDATRRGQTLTRPLERGIEAVLHDSRLLRERREGHQSTRYAMPTPLRMPGLWRE
jgi:tRNA pseudouridine55 synthase